MNGDNGIWAQLLRAKYLKGVQFINATRKPGGSYTWRSILSSQSLVSSTMAKLVLNGRTTSFWHDKWLFDKPLSSLCQYQIPLHMNSTTVQELYSEGNWSRELLNLLPSNLWAKLSLFTLSASEEDQVIWTASPHGQFSVGSAYNLVSGASTVASY